MRKIDRRHGGPWDRGNADRYYGRPRDAHFYVGATGSSRRIGKEDMTDQEIDEYNRGYDAHLS